MVFDSALNSLWYFNGTSWGELSAVKSNLWTITGTNINNTNLGNVGIGAVIPGDKLEINGNLRFTGVTPSINTGGSYIVIPQLAYFSGGTTYFQNQLQARGGVNNDQGTLTLTGTTSIVNCASPYFMVAGKYAIDGTDGYLRLNQQNSFPNGIYTPYSFWADGAITTLNRLGAGTVTPGYRLQVYEPNSGAIATLSENKYVGNVDGIGVQGNAINNPGYGSGGVFTGGYRGIQATTFAGSYSGSGYGVYANCTGTTGTRYGVFASA